MKKIFIVYILIPLLIQCEEKSERSVILKRGNLALPASQRPRPTFGFGQNIVDEGDFLALCYITSLRGKERKRTVTIPYTLYGITDDLAFLVNIPIASRFKEGNNYSSGISDTILTAEYAFYNAYDPRYWRQAIFVGSIYLPTGSFNKTPPTGFGSPSFFLGITTNHMAIDWYFFASAGTLLTTFHNNTKVGNQFVFQFGVSKNIAYRTDEWFLTWMVECFGICGQKDVIDGILIPDSNDKDLFIGPSLLFSTQKFILQGGIAFDAAQKWQLNKNHALIAVNIGWKFN